MILIQGSYPKAKKHANKLMNSSYFEFYFPFVDESVTFREINRFNDESRRLTRFKNKYTGNVAINITEWADKPLNRYFIAFAYYILDRTLELCDSKVMLICECTCSQAFLNELEEHFGDKIELVDLGTKDRESDRRRIGFVTCNDAYSARNTEEDIDV
ncbi:MAG: hypothetical protein IJ298_03600 [Ruminococcus sp.]|nr:hypothetical protein [Ruminococcus sp.]